MDFSKLSANERLGAYGAIAAIVGTIVAQIGGAFGAGGLWLTLLLGIAMLAIVFLPQWSPQTALPGSKGSLMLIVGGIAALGAILGLLGFLSVVAFLGEVPLLVIGLLVGIIGGLLMGWAGWQEFQAEGGKFQLGSSTSGTTAAPPPSATTPTEPSAPVSAPPPADEVPPARDVDDRPTS